MNLVNVSGIVYDETHVPASNTVLSVKEVGTNTLVPLYATANSGTALSPVGETVSNVAGAFSFFVQDTKVVYLVVDPAHQGYSVAFSSGSAGSGTGSSGSFNVPGVAHAPLLSDGNGGMTALSLGTTGQSITTDGTNVFWGTPTAPLSGATGSVTNLAFTTNSQIAAGQSAFNTGTGFWFGEVAGVPKVSIGNPSGQHLTWDGTNLGLTLLQANLSYAAAPVAQLGTLEACGYSTGTSVTTSTVQFNTDGTISALDGGAWRAAGHWYLPTTPGIGNSHAIRFTGMITSNAGVAYANTWQSLSAARSVSVENWAANTSGILQVDTLRVEISSSITGVPVVGVGRIAITTQSVA